MINSKYNIYQWISRELPIPHEIKIKFTEIGRTLTSGEANYVYDLHKKCVGPGGKGFLFFATDQILDEIFPPQFEL